MVENQIIYLRAFGDIGALEGDEKELTDLLLGVRVLTRASALARGGSACWSSVPACAGPDPAGAGCEGQDHDRQE